MCLISAALLINRMARRTIEALDLGAEGGLGALLYGSDVLGEYGLEDMSFWLEEEEGRDDVL